MPGFNIGGSASSSDPANTTETNRAHRWRIMSLGENLIDSDMLLYAKTLTLPNLTVEEEVITSAAIKYKFAKTVNWEDVTIGFYDVVGLYDSLVEWQNLVWTTDGGIQPASVYKKECRFEQVDNTGEPINQFILHGSWPKQITHSPLSYESSEIKMIDLILSYDFVTYSPAS